MHPVHVSCIETVPLAPKIPTGKQHHATPHRTAVGSARPACFASLANDGAAQTVNANDTASLIAAINAVNAGSTTAINITAPITLTSAPGGQPRRGFRGGSGARRL